MMRCMESRHRHAARASSAETPLPASRAVARARTGRCGAAALRRCAVLRRLLCAARRLHRRSRLREADSRDAPAAYKESEGWKVAQPQDEIPRGKWWEIFNDPQLNALVEQVDVSNQTIAVAQAQLPAGAGIGARGALGVFPDGGRGRRRHALEPVLHAGQPAGGARREHGLLALGRRILGGGPVGPRPPQRREPTRRAPRRARAICRRPG